jgi:hypothetical protein
VSEPLHLKVILQRRGPAAAIVLTDAQVEALGAGAKTPPVTVTVNRTFTFAGRVWRMGGENLVGFNQATRTAAGVEAGDTVDVVIALDGGERAVDIPDDLAVAMSEAGVADAFSALAPSHRKEYVRWVTEAKKPETRAKRVAEAVPRIGRGQPRR